MSAAHALRGLCGRYTQVFATAWSARRSTDTVPRRRDENDFLPAALALRDTPVHPAPRVAMWIIIGLLSVAVIWASVGKVDVVATAPGKIIPNGNIKTIQPEDTAVVTAIHVKDGQRVKRGDPLIDLDATDATSDAAHAQSDLYATRSELARAQAMLGAIDHHRSPRLSADVVLGSPQAEQSEQHVLDGEYADYTDNLGKLQADMAQSVASLHETDAEIRKLRDMLPIEHHKEQDYAELNAKGYVGTHDYYNEQQAVIQMEQDLAAQRSKRVEIDAALASASRKRDAYVAEVRKHGWKRSMRIRTKPRVLSRIWPRRPSIGV